VRAWFSLSPHGGPNDQPRLGVAARLAQSHRIPVPRGESRLADTLRAWLELVPATYTDATKADYARRHLDPRVIRAEIDWLLDVRACGGGGGGPASGPPGRRVQALAHVPSPVVLSHNDLLCQNVIWNPRRQSVDFIDFEYATPSHRGFDIGNHFNEFAGASW
jgi:hypothetical protein